MPYFVTVILTYHGVTEEALTSVDPEEVAGMEEAGSGVDTELILVRSDQLWSIELQMMVREDFAITEKAPSPYEPFHTEWTSAPSITDS